MVFAWGRVGVKSISVSDCYEVGANRSRPVECGRANGHGSAGFAEALVMQQFTSASGQPRVTAVIVTYRNGVCLWACLEAALGEPAIGQIVVVDNGNTPEVAAELRQRAADPRLTLIEGQGNVGFARACNLGAAAADGDWLIFLNPDLTLRPGAVTAMLQAAEGRRAPCIVGGRLLDVSGREQRGARRALITPWRAAVAFSGLHRILPLSPAFADPHWERQPVPSGPISVGAVSGALLLVRASDYRALGGFDEGYFLHVEDLDLCRRAQEAGGEVVFQPAAEGVHIGCASDAASLFVERCKAQGFARYFKRFARTPGERLAAAALTPVLYALFSLRGALKRARPRPSEDSPPAGAVASSSSPPRSRLPLRARA